MDIVETLPPGVTTLLDLGSYGDIPIISGSVCKPGMGIAFQFSTATVAPATSTMPLGNGPNMSGSPDAPDWNPISTWQFGGGPGRYTASQAQDGSTGNSAYNPRRMQRKDPSFSPTLPRDEFLSLGIRVYYFVPLMQALICFSPDWRGSYNPGAGLLTLSVERYTGSLEDYSGYRLRYTHLGNFTYSDYANPTDSLGFVSRDLLFGNYQTMKDLADSYGTVAEFGSGDAAYLWIPPTSPPASFGLCSLRGNEPSTFPPTTLASSLSLSSPFLVRRDYKDLERLTLENSSGERYGMGVLDWN